MWERALLIRANATPLTLGVLHTKLAVGLRIHASAPDAQIARGTDPHVVSSTRGPHRVGALARAGDLVAVATPAAARITLGGGGLRGARLARRKDPSACASSVGSCCRAKADARSARMKPLANIIQTI